MENDLNKNILTDRDVTEHTASLWKYNPVPESPEPYPEDICRSEKAGGLEITAASVRGKKHKHDGSNRDDSFAFEFVDVGVVTVVSDGAGSKKFSRIGAKCVCRAAAEYVKISMKALKARLPEYTEFLGMSFESEGFGRACAEIAGILRGSYAVAYDAVEAACEKRKDLPEFMEAVGREPEIKDFSCTLLTALTIPVETENGREFFTAAIQVGDGMIAAVDANAHFGNALAVLGTADSGSFAGETEFITSENMCSPENLMSRTKIRRGKMTHLMLMTDGVADDYYPNDPQLLRLFADLRLNGIIPFGDSVTEPAESAEIPEPVAYPWVNDSDVKYSLQYAKNILSAGNISLEELWENAGIQKKASLASFGTVHETDRGEMLKVWLDNYVERGSFDDRTLLILSADNVQE